MNAIPSQLPQPQLSPIRLLVVSSDTFPPQRVDVSVLFGEELGARGHKIDWILQSEAACARPYMTRWAGSTVWVGPTDLGSSVLRRVRKHLLGILNDARLFRILRGGAYDAIEVKDKFLSAVFALLAARRYGKRFIYWLSYPFPEEYLIRSRDGTARYPLLYRIRGHVFHFLLYRILLPRADHIFVQSEQMARDVAAQGIARANMSVVPMGIRTADIPSTVRSKRGVIPADELCFVYLGSVSRRRRSDFLLRVLAKVRAELPAARLYLVGGSDDPTDLDFIRSEAERLQVGANVVLTGMLPRTEALRYVMDADVCVSDIYPNPILNAGSPTKLIEYMGLGKAVVANTHPEQQLLIDASQCGYCVPYEEGEFATAIIKLLRSPEIARAMGERGRRYALEHRTYTRIADCVEQRLAQVACKSCY